MRADGSVACWGSSGQSTYARAESRAQSRDVPLRMVLNELDAREREFMELEQSGGFSFVGTAFVGAESEYACGLRADGSLVCWGYDDEGEAMSPEEKFASVNARGAYAW